jgi:Protein of unknown function (DUF3108)
VQLDNEIISMRLRFLNIAGFVALFLSPAYAPTELLKPPASAKSEKGTTTTSLKGGPLRWKSEWTMEREVGQGQPTVRFTEKGSGRYSGFNQEVRWNIETTWTSAEAFRPLSSERTVMDMAGKPLLRERKSFNFDKRTVDIEREDFSTGRMSRRSLSIPADTLAVDGIAGALRSLPFERSRPVELHLLSNEPRLYDVSFEVRGRERVRTPAGQFECYKVEIHPGLGVLKLFGFLVPNAYFWFTVEAPHYWVRYEGPENGRGTPQVVMELATFEQTN